LKISGGRNRGRTLDDSLHSLVFQPCFQIRFLYVLFPFPETGANFSIDSFEGNEQKTEWKCSLPDHLVFGLRVVGTRAEGCLRQPLYEADVRSDIKEERQGRNKQAETLPPRKMNRAHAAIVPGAGDGGPKSRRLRKSLNVAGKCPDAPSPVPASPVSRFGVAGDLCSPLVKKDPHHHHQGSHFGPSEDLPHRPRWGPITTVSRPSPDVPSRSNPDQKLYTRDGRNLCKP
jgi:hypothetical protein